MLASKFQCFAAAKSLQSCPTLWDPIDSSPLGSSFPGILQARILEWVAISFSNAWKWKVKVKSLSCARLLVTPWTVAYQAPLSMGFSRQEYWSGVPLPSPRAKATSPHPRIPVPGTVLGRLYSCKWSKVLVKHICWSLLQELWYFWVSWKASREHINLDS